MPIATINTALAVLTIIGQVIFVVVLAVLVLERKNSRLQTLRSFISRYALFAAFITALAATLGSLYYSEIARYTPCTLCWYQRIAMYPQVVLLGIAAFWRDRNIANYNITLSSIGGLVAIFHYREQIAATPLFACSAVGASVSCTERFTTHFGYITIPLMAATAFAMIILFLIAQKRRPAA